MVRERSTGTEREVDILLEDCLFGTALRLAFECRGRRDKDDIEWIDGLIGKVTDLDIDKVVAVSGSGFTPAAVAKARAHRIDTLTLQRARDTDWSKACSPLGIGRWARTDTLQTIGVSTDPPCPPPLHIDASVFLADGARVGCLGDLGWAIYFGCREAITARIQEQSLTFFKTPEDLRSNPIFAVLELPSPLPILVGDGQGKQYKVRGIRLRVRCDFTAEGVPVDHYALGDARLTRATIDCPLDRGSFAVTALQTIGKPGQLRCYTDPVLPAAPTQREENDRDEVRGV